MFTWKWKGNVEIYVCICERCGTRMATLCDRVGVGWETVSGYIQIHQDTHTCRPDAGSCSVRSTGIRDRIVSYLGGTTKASSCCWLHTSPAEPVYSRHTAAGITRLTPLYCTFLMNPMITLPEMLLCKSCSAFSVICETLVVCFTFALLLAA